MNKNKTLLIIALVFVLLLGGADVLYNRLAQDAAPDQLAVQGAPAAGQTEQDADTPQEEDEGEEEGQEPERPVFREAARGWYACKLLEVHVYRFTH